MGDDKKDEEDKKEDGGADGGIILGGKKSKDKEKHKNEIAVLRSNIQTLCQSSNPLGKCLEFVQEDMDSMGRELETWKADSRMYSSKLQEEARITEQTLQ